MSGTLTTTPPTTHVACGHPETEHTPELGCIWCDCPHRHNPRRQPPARYVTRPLPDGGWAVAELRTPKKDTTQPEHWFVLARRSTEMEARVLATRMNADPDNDGWNPPTTTPTPTLITVADIPPGALIVTVGAGGAGKTHWADTHFPGHRVGLNLFRARFGQGESDHAATPNAIRGQRFLIALRLRQGALTVVDDNHLYSVHRRALAARARRYHRAAVVISFASVPLADIQARNAHRSPLREASGWPRRLPAETVARQHRKVCQYDNHWFAAEGFDYIIE